VPVSKKRHANNPKRHKPSYRYVRPKPQNNTVKKKLGEGKMSKEEIRASFKSLIFKIVLLGVMLFILYSIIGRYF